MQWNASWIWHPPTENPDNFYIYARRELDLKSPPAEANLCITAGCLYKLYVNGTYVGRGPNPSDPSRYYYDVHTVSGHLRSGVNTICVVAYTYGPASHGILGQNFGKGGLLVELRAPGRHGDVLLVTDNTWKVIQAPEWDQNAAANCTLLHDYKETYDSTREIEGWMDVGFDDTTWLAPDVWGAPPDEPYTTLVEREIPFFVGEVVRPLDVAWESASVTYAWRDDWEVYHEQRLAPKSHHRGQRDREMPVWVEKTHDDFTPAITLDFGRDVTGYPEITIADSKGGVVDVLYAEDAFFVRVDRFILKGGRQVLQPFNRRTFRYIKLVFPETPSRVEIDDVSMEMSTYPVNTRAGAFSCSDDVLTKIYEVGKYTMRMSMLDHFVDCPWRERTLYGGDLYAENLIAHYAFGAARMNRKCLRQIFHLQYEQGALPPYGPYSGCHGFYPSWTAFFALGFVDHYRLYADGEFLDELWPKFVRLVEWSIGQTEGNEYGLIGVPARGEGGSFDEWMAAAKVRFDPWQNFPFQKLLAEGAWLAEQRSDGKLAKRWAKAGAQMAKALQKHMVDGESKAVVPIAADKKRHHSGQYDTSLALWCGYPDTGEGLAMARALFDSQVGKIGAPFHGLFVSEGLFAYDEDTAAVEFIKKYWGQMLELGHGTFFDNYSLDWSAGFQVDRQTSLCHGWAAGPTYSLPAHVLGVQPLEPGFTKVLVQPQPGGLSWAAGVVPTPQGPISISWQRSEERFRIEVVAPEGVPVQLELPPHRGRTRQVLAGGMATRFTWDGARQVVQLRAGRRTVVEQVEPNTVMPARS